MSRKISIVMNHKNSLETETFRVKNISAVPPDSEIETNVLGVYRHGIPECQETINNWLE